MKKIKGLLITHGELGKELLNVAEEIMERKSGIEILNMSWIDDGTTIEKKINKVIKRNRGNNTLIMVDMFGGSPANLSLRFNNDETEILTGINLPGLLKFITLKEKTDDFSFLVNSVKESSKEGINIISEYLGEKKNVKTKN